MIGKRKPNRPRLSGSQTPATARGAVPAYIELPVYHSTAASAQSGLLEYWRVFRRHKLLVLITLLAGAGCGLLVTRARQPIYQARTTLEVSALNENPLNTRNGAGPGDGSAEEVDIQTHAKLLESRALFAGVVRKLESERPNGKGRASIADSIRDFRIRPAERTRVLEVICDSSDPKLAAAFANTLASEYINQTLQARWDSAVTTTDWLSRELQGLRTRLQESEDQLQAYMQSAGLVYTDTKGSAAQEQLRTLQEELGHAQTEVIARRSRFETASTAGADAVSGLEASALEDYERKLTDLRRQEVELTASYTPAHYKVQRVHAQIDELQKAVERERENVRQRIESDYRTALRRESLLTDAYRRLTGQVLYQNAQMMRFDLLKREVDTSRLLYESMLQRLKEVRVAAALRASNVRIVDPARPPAKPYKPDPISASALGLIGGMLAGSIFAFIREKTDQRIREPGEAAEWLQVPELGTIISARRDPLRLPASARAGTRVLPGTGSRPEETADNRLELVTWSRKDSLLAESFRTTMTSILNAGTPCRVLVFASPLPSEGKTTIVSNLGIALSAMGRRVLIIDGDVRKPSMHEIFGLPNELGILDLLTGKVSSEAYDEVIVPTRRPGLHVLPGRTGSGDADLLHSLRLNRLLLRLRHEYDMILIDTPAMLHLADARVFGQMADGVVLVCRARTTSRDAAQSARQQFVQDGTFVLGTILNDWDPGIWEARKKEYYKHYGSAT